jgi:hypothetical protein
MIGYPIATPAKAGVKHLSVREGGSCYKTALSFLAETFLTLAFAGVAMK